MLPRHAPPGTAVRGRHEHAPSQCVSPAGAVCSRPDAGCWLSSHHGCGPGHRIHGSSVYPVWGCLCSFLDVHGHGESYLAKEAVFDICSVQAGEGEDQACEAVLEDCGADDRSVCGAECGYGEASGAEGDPSEDGPAVGVVAGAARLVACPYFLGCFRVSCSGEGLVRE